MELLLADNGVGIEKEDLKHIFERLYKCDKGHSEKGSSSCEYVIVLCGNLTIHIYTKKELARQIDSGYYERLLLSNGKAPSAIESKDMTGVLRDMYMLELYDIAEEEMKNSQQDWEFWKCEK